MRLPKEHVLSTTVPRIFLFYANVLAALISLSSTFAHAEAPKQFTALGLKLGQPPELVQSLLTRVLPRCNIDPSIYHQSEGYPDKVTAIFDVGVNRVDVCRSGPAAGQVQDSLSLTFAHPSIVASQPLYQIRWHRAFPDVALVPDTKIRYSFDKTRAELFRTYGRPIDVHEEKVRSAAANLAGSLSLDKNVQRETKLVRYLWATEGRLPEDKRSTVCDCGARYVMATLEISRSRSTVPKDQYFMLSLTVFVRDNDIGARQDEWNAQWQNVK